MHSPRFIGLSTGRSGSRYLAELLNRAGVETVHEQSRSAADWERCGAMGEVTAWLVAYMDAFPEVLVWHFSRHPQPFVSSLIGFGFWNMCHPAIHPHLRRTGDVVADSFLYWVDWNQRIIDGAPHPRRTTFRIEDVNADLISWLANAVDIDADVSGLEPAWNEKQEFASIPDEVAPEVDRMMEVLGYAPCS